MKNNNTKLNKSPQSPVVSWDNVEQFKKAILVECRNKSGVYRWVNNINKKSYVGSGVNLARRFSFYFLLSGKILAVVTATKGESNLNRRKRGRSHIYNALLEYGYSKILEYCDPSKCIEREQYYLDRLKPEYNILKYAGSCLGRLQSKEARQKISESKKGSKHSEGTLEKFRARAHSEEIRKKISEAMEGVNRGRKHSEEAKLKMSEVNKGRKHSTETKVKISEAMKGNKHSEETKLKMSEAKKGNKASLGRNRPEGAGKPSVSIEVLDLFTDIKTVYASLGDAERALDVPAGKFARYFYRNTQKPYKGRYKLSKV